MQINLIYKTAIELFSTYLTVVVKRKNQNLQGTGNLAINHSKKKNREIIEYNEIIVDEHNVCSIVCRLIIAGYFLGVLLTQNI